MEVAQALPTLVLVSQLVAVQQEVPVVVARAVLRVERLLAQRRR